MQLSPTLRHTLELDILSAARRLCSPQDSDAEKAAINDACHLIVKFPGGVRWAQLIAAAGLIRRMASRVNNSLDDRSEDAATARMVLTAASDAVRRGEVTHDLNRDHTLMMDQILRLADDRLDSRLAERLAKGFCDNHRDLAIHAVETAAELIVVIAGMSAALHDTNADSVIDRFACELLEKSAS